MHKRFTLPATVELELRKIKNNGRRRRMRKEIVKMMAPRKPQPPVGFSRAMRRGNRVGRLG